MSSRALRKLQKERERQQLEKSSVVEASEDEEMPTRGKTSAFAMLADTEAEDEDEDATQDDADEVDDSDPKSQEDESLDAAHQPDLPRAGASTSTPRNKKKKRKKKAAVAKTEAPVTDADDIDAALKSLSTLDKPGADSMTNETNPALQELCKNLAIDTQHLQVANEMRRLFGKAAFDVDHDQEAEGRRNRRQGEGEQIGLADAVAGKNSQGGAGLPQIIRRRNAFVQGKEEWPKASGGGLGMEIVEKRAGGIIEYRFTHNKIYQSSQKEFDTCVLSMDPNLMVNLLRYNPYHVASLLQVSEIAKQERDHTTSGDLLERALFSFGRAAHSSFAASLAQGKARIDFRRPENREFYLAAWRYIANISMRATWRTAYEWARLLLSVNPGEDPYQIRFVIDQLALRARQPQSLLDLVNCEVFKDWRDQLPNIAYSIGLALLNNEKSEPRQSKRYDAAENQLCEAIVQFPWVAAGVFQALDVIRIPPPVWGSEPPADMQPQMLKCALYITQALDLWKSTEAKECLVEAASKADPEEKSTLAEHRDIQENEARHVILADKPALIALLPRELSSQIGSMSDPLPPQDSIKSYETGISDSAQPMAASDPNEMIQTRPHAFIHELAELSRIFEMLIPGFTERLEGRPNPQDPLTLTEADVARALEHSNLPPQALVQLLERLVRFRQVLSEQPEETVRSPEGGEAIMDERGVARIRMGQTSDDFVVEEEREEVVDDT